MINADAACCYTHQEWPTTLSEMGDDWNTSSGRAFAAMVWMAGFLLGWSQPAANLLTVPFLFDRAVLDFIAPVFMMLVGLVPVQVGHIYHESDTEVLGGPSRRRSRRPGPCSGRKDRI